MVVLDTVGFDTSIVSATSLLDVVIMPVAIIATMTFIGWILFGTVLDLIKSRKRKKKERTPQVTEKPAPQVTRVDYGMHVSDDDGRIHYISYDEIYGSPIHPYKSRELEKLTSQPISKPRSVPQSTPHPPQTLAKPREIESDKYLSNSEWMNKQKTRR